MSMYSFGSFSSFRFLFCLRGISAISIPSVFVGLPGLFDYTQPKLLVQSFSLFFVGLPGLEPGTFTLSV